MMDFPILQSRDANVVSDQLSTLEGMESPHLEHQPMLDLEFPSFVRDTRKNNKRPAHPNSTFPSAKRHNVVPPVLDSQAPPDTEEKCWIDSLLESWNQEEESFEINSLGSCPVYQYDMYNASEMTNKPIPISKGEVFKDPPSRIIFPTIQEGGGQADRKLYGYRKSQLEPEALQQDRVHRIPAQLKCDRSISEAAATASMSPLLNPSQPGGHQVVPQLETPQRQIPYLFSSTEPTLLTLTSYPFRIIYSNEAFSKLSSGRKRSVIGDSIFDTFAIEGKVLSPCLATYPTLQGRLENCVAIVPSFPEKKAGSPHRWIRCGIQASPVTKRNDGNALRYFTVRFTPLDLPTSRC